MKKIMSYDDFKMHTFYNLSFDIEQYTDEELRTIVIEYANKFDNEYDNFKEILLSSNIISESSSEEEINELIKDKMYPKHLNIKDYL